MKIRTSLIALVVALSFGLTAVVAQQGQMQQQPPANIDVSDQQLEQFADAQVSIIEIQQDFSERLQGVEDPERAQELQTQANEEMTSAVDEAGLDVESFNAIAMAIQNDPDLQQRLTQMLQDTR
jgi:GTP1/Obg family GTP-binding protein